jgi:hypothetical protein
MSRYLLGIVTQSLQGRSPAQCPIFNHVIECTWALLEFNVYARYTSHDDATLCWMEGSSHRFHTLKDVSFLGRAAKTPNAKANALTMQLLKSER